MIEGLKALPDSVFISYLIAAGVIVSFINWKLGAFFSGMNFKKQSKGLEKDHENVQKGLKRILDDEKSTVEKKYIELKEKIEEYEQRLESYRRKISGLGVFSFTGSKKRSDILYSLLLENEALEQLLNQQSARISEQSNQHLKEKLMDIQKRQRLMSEIFNDGKIKDYVREILSTDEGETEEKKASQS